jgi:cobalt-zinc-cadmium efflux system protein
VAQRPATLSKTYGFYRAEVLSAAVNALVLLGIGGFILYEAWGRFHEPHPVDSLPMLLVASGGLVVNLIAAWTLHADAEHSLNVRGAFLEVVADVLGSVGVIVAAVVIFLTGWTPIDALVSALIGLLILPRTWSLLKTALDVLLEATPAHLDLDAIAAAMREVRGVASVHDLHVWTITSGFVAMSGHVQARTRPSGDVLHDLQDLLRERFGIEHVTLQVESDDHVDEGACCVMDPRCLPGAIGPSARSATLGGRR